MAGPINIVFVTDQWNILGDHKKVSDFTNGGRMARSEETCSECGTSFAQHGFISSLNEGVIVCPGNWIISDTAGRVYGIGKDMGQVNEF